MSRHEPTPQVPKEAAGGILRPPKRLPRGFSRMPTPVIVVHYHELWLKGRNRKFFLGKLVLALRRALADFPIRRFAQPGDRVLIHLSDGAPLEQIIARLRQISGIAYFAVARTVDRRSSDDFDA